MRVRDSLRAPVVSLLSQGTGLVQLLLILGRAGTGQATDAYFYLFNLGLVPIFCIVVGMMYPSLLTDNKISRSGLMRIRWATSLLSVLFVVGGALWLSAYDRLASPLVGLAVVSTLNTLVQSRLWFRAVAAEAGGNALWIAGIALPPNLLAAAVLLYPWNTPASAMTAMVSGLLVGNLGLLAFMARHDVGKMVLNAAPPNTGSPGGSFWFLSLASIEFLGQTVLQSLAVLLPPSSITLLNVGYRIVGSVSATFVNATMPSLVHQTTDSPRSARRFLRVVVFVVGVCAITIVVGVRIVRPDLLVPTMVLAMWLIASAAAAVAARMSFRFLAPHASTRTIGVVITVVVLAVLSSRGAEFNLTVLLCGYAAMDGAAAMLLLWPLKDRLMSLVLAGTLAGLGAVWASIYL